MNIRPTGSSALRPSARWRWALVAQLAQVALVVSCARQGFNRTATGDAARPADTRAAGDGLSDGLSDVVASTDRSDTPIACPWTGSWTLSPPERIDELSSPYAESEPFVTADGLTIFFCRIAEVFAATRPAVGQPFGEVVPLDGINSEHNETRFAVSADGSTAYLSAIRPGGPGGADLWIGQVDAPFAQLAFGVFRRDDVLSTVENDYDPFPSADHLRLYYVIDSGGASVGRQDIVVAARSSPQEPFGAPVPLAGINTSSGDDNPAVTADELLLVFGSRRPGGLGRSDLWYAQRSSRDAAFAEPQPVPVVNSESDDTEVFISADGCELFFASDRPGSDLMDLYRSRYVHQAP